MAVWKKILVSGSNTSELNNDSGFATTGSNSFTGSQYVSGNFTVIGDITAQQYIVSSSVIYVTQSNYSGSNVFGNSMDDTHQFTGSVYITGSLNVTSGITGSLFGTASWAYSSSQALTASYSDQAANVVLTVINQTGTQIDKGAVVRISGSNNASDTPRISLADWTNDGLSANTIGFVMDNIANGGTGKVLTEGLFIGYDTSTPGWTSGQLLFLSSSGTITGSAPQAPLHAVRLGQVIRVQSNNGSIYVRIDNGYEIDELHDVKITSATDGDLLVRSSSVWINSKTLSGSYILSGSLTTTNGITGSLFGTSSWSTNALTASYGDITGSLFGTASWAYSSSQAITASYIDATNITTGTLSNTRLPSQINVTGVTASFTGSLTGALIGTSSWATNALTASYGNLTGSLFGTSSWAYSSSQALTASYVNTLNQTIINTGSVIFAGTTSAFGGTRNGLYLKNNNTSGNQSSLIQFGSSGTAQTWALITDLNADGTTINQLDFYNTPLGNSALTLKSNGSALFLNSVTASNFVGTASWATSASQALTASYITGSSFTSTNPALSASYALTASYALNGGGGSIGPGLENTLALWDTTTTIASSSIIYFSNDTNQALVSESLYHVNADGLKIQNAQVNNIVSSSNSNMFVDNISPASNYKTISHNNQAVIKRLNLKDYMLNTQKGCYGLIIDYNLVLGANPLFEDSAQFTYDNNAFPDYSLPTTYVETGRIYLSWLGSSKTQGGAVGKGNVVTYITMNPTISNAITAGWDVVDNNILSNTTLGASEEGVAAPYNVTPLRDQNNGYQFGYKLVNDSTDWYVEVAVFNDTSVEMLMTYTTKILTLFTNP